jgi:hypothetical protein
MKIINIHDLHQAEDRDLKFDVSINFKDVVDVADILFVVVPEDTNVPVISIRMGEFATFEDSTITIRLRDTYTTNMVGKYRYELWFRDSFENDVPTAKGTLKFKTTFGRY